jgi:NAD(P)-dependent dehydrogenase (short-subunit alcohol dehydrogenase family)
MNRTSELFSVEGKRVLVTGAARGLGRMLAQGFVERGAVVYITSNYLGKVHAQLSLLAWTIAACGRSRNIWRRPKRGWMS